MNNMFPRLFERGRIGTLSLDNRIIKAATQVNMLNPDGSVTDRLVEFFAEEARGGTALIITGMARVSSHEIPPHPTLGINEDGYIQMLSALAQAIQYNGAKAGIQLAHFGSHAGSPLLCVSLKGVEYDIWFPLHHPECNIQKGYPHQEYTIDEIQNLVRDYGDAALRAKEAGFDMLEVHAAHGHGLSMFMSPLINQRMDIYGGSAGNRRRMLLEIIEDIREKVGRHYPICVRLNGADNIPDGLTIEESIETALALEQAGVDLIHMSNDGAAAPMMMPMGINIWAAEAVKREVKIPVVASGCITTPELAEETLAKGKADFVSLARPLFADPEWSLKARDGRPEHIRPCIRCNDGCTMRTGKGSIQCSVNAALGKRLSPAVTVRLKKVAVIGGGPAGLEASRVCALQGHKVTLFEKRQLGGALIEASVPDFKADLRELLRYFLTCLKDLKVEVVNKTADTDTIRTGGFDAAIVAVGAVQYKPDVPGIGNPIVADALDILGGRVRPGKRIHVVGGGLIGTEVALFLAEQDKEVILTSRQKEITNSLLPSDRSFFLERLNQQNVIIYTGRELKSISGNGSNVVDDKGRLQNITVDNVVLASGYVPQTDLRDRLEKVPHLDVYAAGDCLGSRLIFDAIHEGHMAALKV